MQSIEDIHAKIREQFATNLVARQVDDETANQLAELIGNGPCPKPAALLAFYENQVLKETAACSKSKA